MHSDRGTSETEIGRVCVVCGSAITVTVFDDGTYDGGHYFDIEIPDSGEYWECEECYGDTEDQND